MSQQHPWLVDGDMFAYHLSTNIRPDKEPTIDPRLIERDKQLDRQTMTTRNAQPNNFFEPINDNESLQNTALSTSHSPPTTLEHLISPNKHVNVQAIGEHFDTNPAYFSKKGIFREEEKTLIQQYSHEAPSLVMERLKELIPATTTSYKQIKGAVENERRKKNRRELNGPWTQEEMQLIAQNMKLTPKEMVRLLKDNVDGFVKNVDQVRDMKSQIAQKTKGRAWKRSSVSEE